MKPLTGMSFRAAGTTLWLVSVLAVAVDRTAAAGAPPCGANPPPDHVVLQIDPERSFADIAVGKEGPFRLIGHDHAIVARPRSGVLLLTPGLIGSCAELEVSVAAMEVDPPAARARQGMPPGPNVKGIEGTRRNMLERVLDAGQWPTIRIRVRWVDGVMAESLVEANIELRGVTRSLLLPVRLEAHGRETVITGAFSLRQSDWGISPFKAAMGGLRVRDAVAISFELIAAQASH